MANYRLDLPKPLAAASCTFCVSAFSTSDENTVMCPDVLLGETFPINLSCNVNFGIPKLLDARRRVILPHRNWPRASSSVFSS